jgi:hypothetical protein
MKFSLIAVALISNALASGIDWTRYHELHPDETNDGNSFSGVIKEHGPTDPPVLTENIDFKAPMELEYNHRLYRRGYVSTFSPIDQGPSSNVNGVDEAPCDGEAGVLSAHEMPYISEPVVHVAPTAQRQLPAYENTQVAPAVQEKMPYIEPVVHVAPTAQRQTPAYENTQVAPAVQEKMPYIEPVVVVAPTVQYDDDCDEEEAYEEDCDDEGLDIIDDCDDEGLDIIDEDDMEGDHFEDSQAFEQDEGDNKAFQQEFDSASTTPGQRFSKKSSANGKWAQGMNWQAVLLVAVLFI